ncbi:MAG: DinB family protein [Pyrinomonadaceae bacterium]|nr:DinB family protein [Pyrinomonadaceae bacterium]
MRIEKPQTGEYSPYAITYIDLVNDNGILLNHLADNLKTTVDLITSLPEEKLLHRYADGKWTIKEMLVHVIDAERIFAYRALRFARNDKTDLPGFEQDDYVAESKANAREISDILTEYIAVRTATITLFRGLDANVLTNIGESNGNQTSVRALAYMIAGHELHHLKIINERYI